MLSAANVKRIIQKVAPPLIIVSTLSIFVLHVLALVYVPYLNHDVAFFLTAGQMLIEGSWPYVDIIDVNLPMIIYLSAIPAAYAHLTHASLAVAGSMFLFLLVIITMLLFGKMLNIIIPTLTHHQIYFMYVVWLMCSLWVYHHGDFGQREQLIFLFLAPFVLLRYTRYTQVRAPLYLEITISSLAFCGIAMKPFYLLPILIIEVIYIVIYRHLPVPFFSIETLLWLCFGLVYLTHFYMIPGMSSFYDYWLGILLRGYHTYSTHEKMALLQELLNRRFMHVYLLSAILLCFLVFYKKNSLLLLSACYGWFACCSLVLYIWQAKSWSYQMIPFFCGIFVGGGLFFLGLQKHLTSKSWVAMPMLALITMSTVALSFPIPFALLSASLQLPPFDFPRNATVEAIEHLTTPEDRVLFLSLIPNNVFPALTYTGRKFAGRFLCAFPLAFFFRYSSDYTPGEQWKEDEARFYEMLKEDVHMLQPRMIFIDTRKLGLSFEISEYLRRKGFFTLFSSSYRHIGEIDQFEVYLLIG